MVGRSQRGSLRACGEDGAREDGRGERIAGSACPQSGRGRPETEFNGELPTRGIQRHGIGAPRQRAGFAGILARLFAAALLLTGAIGADQGKLPRTNVRMLHPRDGGFAVLLDAAGANLRVFANVDNPDRLLVRMTVSVGGGDPVVTTVGPSEEVDVALLLNDIPPGEVQLRVAVSTDQQPEHALDISFTAVLPSARVAEVTPAPLGGGGGGAGAVDVRWELSEEGLLCRGVGGIGAVVLVNGRYAGVTRHKWVRVDRVLIDGHWAPLCALRGAPSLRVEVRLTSAVGDIPGSEGALSVAVERWEDPCTPVWDRDLEGGGGDGGGLEPWGKHLKGRPDPCAPPGRPVLLRPKRFAVFLGLGKTGTTSLYFSMGNAGVPTAQYKDEWGYLHDRIYRARREGRELLAYLQQYDCLVLCSIEKYPQMDSLHLLTEQYPDSLFLLNTRDTASHIRSMDRWLHDEERGHTMRQTLTIAEIPMLPAGKGAKDEEMTAWLEGFYERTRQHFAQLPHVPFLSFDLLDDYTTMVGSFLGLPSFGKVHANAGARAMV